MKIYALTPNPALDHSGHVSQIVPNEKNYVNRARLDPGGNGINAARIVKRLGAEPLLLGFIGGGAGLQLQQLLDAEGLQHQFTNIAGTTRTNVTVTNDHDHRQTRLTFPGPKVSASEIHRLKKQVSRFKAPGLILLGGSVPLGCSQKFYLELIAAASRRALGIVVDVPAPYLKTIFSTSSPRLTLIKPNQVELEALLGAKLRSDRAIAKAALKLTRRSAIVCVSLAQRGAVFAAAGKVWFARAPRFKAKGTVGAGDSMVGAMASCLARQGLTQPGQIEQADEKRLLEVFRWGVAAGAATAATEGTSLGQPALIRRFYPRISVVRV